LLVKRRERVRLSCRGKKMMRPDEARRGIRARALSPSPSPYLSLFSRCLLVRLISRRLFRNPESRPDSGSDADAAAFSGVCDVAALCVARPILRGTERGSCRFLDSDITSPVGRQAGRLAAGKSEESQLVTVVASAASGLAIHFHTMATARHFHTRESSRARGFTRAIHGFSQ